MGRVGASTWTWVGVVLDILDEDGQLADDLSRFAARVCYLMWGAHTLLSMFVDIHQRVANNLTSGALVAGGEGRPFVAFCMAAACRRTGGDSKIPAAVPPRFPVSDVATVP